MKRFLGAAFIGCFSLALVSSAAFTRPPIQLRGTIEQIDGSMITIKTRYGAPVKLTVTESPQVVAVVKSSLADIKAGDAVGLIGPAEPNGEQRAQTVYILPDSMRNSWQGANGWSPSSQSNVVQQAPTEANGNALTVKSENGEKKFLVTPATTVLNFVEGDRNDLKQGVAIFVADAKKQPEGLVQTSLVIYGRDGVVPPL